MQASVAQQSFILELQIVDNEILQANTKLKSLNLKNNNMTKENFITQKLDSYNFKKNAIYSSMKISEILKINSFSSVAKTMKFKAE